MREFAPAKVNLFLHVGPAANDGYHPICSLMVFADVGDELRIETAPTMEFRVEGRFAADLFDNADNLVIRAREALLARAGALGAFRLTLNKALPIASGVGGGSSDAAATLRLMSSALRLNLDAETLETIALDLGADVPACLKGVPAMVTGRGEVVAPAPRLPQLHAVMVNPLIPTSTSEVFRAYDLGPAPKGANMPALPAGFDSPQDVARILGACRNDLEGPAIKLQPQIGVALARLSEQRESLLARMSGSGATCFSLCADERAALDLEGRLQGLEPSWWVRRCRLGAGAPK